MIELKGQVRRHSRHTSWCFSWRWLSVTTLVTTVATVATAATMATLGHRPAQANDVVVFGGNGQLSIQTPGFGLSIGTPHYPGLPQGYRTFATPYQSLQQHPQRTHQRIPQRTHSVTTYSINGQPVHGQPVHGQIFNGQIFNGQSSSRVIITPQPYPSAVYGYPPASNYGTVIIPNHPDVPPSQGPGVVIQNTRIIRRSDPQRVNIAPLNP